MAQGPEYFVVRRNRKARDRHYWKASEQLRLRLSGSEFKPLVRLSDARVEAEQQCRAITARVRGHLAALPSPASPGWIGERKKRLHAAVRLVHPLFMNWRRTGPDMRQLSVGVYAVVADNGLIKVGFAERPLKRLERMSTGSASPLWLLFFIRLPLGTARQVEKRAHLLLTDYHKHGEWFDAPPALAIAAILEAVVQVTS